MINTINFGKIIRKAFGQNGNQKKGIPGRGAGFALPHELLGLPMSPRQNQVTTTPLPGSSFLLW